MHPTFLLRSSLGANALFSGACGLLLLAWPRSVASWMGAAPAVLYGSVGLALVVFALALVGLAARRDPPPRWVHLVTASDLGWVFGTLLLLSGPGVTAFEARGIRALLIVAMCVLALAVLQTIGLARLSPTRTAGGS
jgi:hypothetical protein